MGQTLSYFANTGEQATIGVTKALSVRTHSTESELEDSRKRVWLGGTQYSRVQVEGEVAASNHRNEQVKLVIHRQFSGELLAADGDPVKRLREEGVHSVNPQRELEWTITLNPGEEKRLKYSYAVLVRG